MLFRIKGLRLKEKRRKPWISCCRLIGILGAHEPDTDIDIQYIRNLGRGFSPSNGFLGRNMSCSLQGLAISSNFQTYAAPVYRMVRRPVAEIAKCLKVRNSLVIGRDRPDMCGVHQSPSRYIEDIWKVADNPAITQSNIEGDMSRPQPKIRSRPADKARKLLKIFHVRCFLNDRPLKG